ncbi:putative DNA-binding transcriptional regulator [Salmonella enterica subsp. enterica]|nr:putative DNA-binding transcriptional regulator [Salmonella enterica subsp. enterica]
MPRRGQTNRRNRWIRQHWKTEKFPGVERRTRKNSSILMPAWVYSQYSGFSQNCLHVLSGGRKQNMRTQHSHAYRQIIDAVENMSAQEQEKLALFFITGRYSRISDALGNQ